MKTTTITTIIALSVIIPLLPLSAEEANKPQFLPQSPEQVEALKQEIKRQELILQALKDRLSVIEKDSAKEEPFVITLVGGQPRLMEADVSIKEIELALNQRAKISSTYPIRIRADEKTPYSSVVQILELAKNAGLSNVAFQTPKE